MHAYHKMGLLLAALGLPHVFVDNDAWYHDPLQLVFAVGMMVYSYPMVKQKFHRWSGKS